jgi:carbon-monoxide dehydrogenase medium subunit
MKLRLAQPGTVVDLSGIAELAGIKKDGNAVVIGAMARHAQVAASDVVKNAIPSLAALAEGIGDRQVRNMGTLGGALANNDPAADWPAAVLALDATGAHQQAQDHGERFLQGHVRDGACC